MTPIAQQLLDEVTKNIEAMERYGDMTGDIEDIHTLGNLLLMYRESPGQQFGKSLADRINDHVRK